MHVTVIIIVTVLVASPDGGVDIEEVAEKTPDRIKKIPVDIHTGVTDEIANEIAKFLGFEGALGKQCAEQVSVVEFRMILRKYSISVTLGDNYYHLFCYFFDTC